MLAPAPSTKTVRSPGIDGSDYRNPTLTVRPRGTVSAPATRHSRLLLLPRLLLALAVELHPVVVAHLPDLRLHRGLGGGSADAAQACGGLTGVPIDHLVDLLRDAILRQAEVGRRTGAAAVGVD